MLNFERVRGSDVFPVGFDFDEMLLSLRSRPLVEVFSIELEGYTLSKPKHDPQEEIGGMLLRLEMRDAADEVIVRIVNVPIYDRQATTKKVETLFNLVQNPAKHKRANHYFQDSHNQFGYVTERNEYFRSSFVYSTEIVPSEVIEAIRKDLEPYNLSTPNRTVTFLTPR